MRTMMLAGCSRVALLAGIMLAPSAAAAQDSANGTVPPAQEQPPPASPQASPAAPASNGQKEIIVTGSRIPRHNLTAVSPVTVVGQEEVKLEGATNAEELLNQLPQVNPSQGEFVSSNATGAATVDLRGLGAGRTLVLINGHRLMPGDPGSPVPDINVVPTSLIQRVEVLTGGAAAVYGSDAVAGVVNFILDTNLKGFRIDGQASVFQHDNRNVFDQGLLQQAGFGYPTGNTIDGPRQDINGAFGTGFLDGRGHITVYAGYRRISELRQDQRDYSACTLESNRTDSSQIECGGSFASYPGNFFDNLNNVYQVTADRTFEPGYVPFNFGPWNFYQRPDRRYTAGGFANFDISDAFKLYAEAMWMKDRSLAQVAPSGDFGETETINCDNPLLSDQQRSLICMNGNYVGQYPIFDSNGHLLGIQGNPVAFTDPVTGSPYYRGWLGIGRRNFEGGPRQDDLRHNSLRLLGGAKGDLGHGLTYDASYSSGRVSMSQAAYNDLSITRLFRALDVVTDPATGQPVCRSVLTGEDPACVPWDVFAVGAVTPEATAYLGEPAVIQGSYKQRIASADINADLGQWGVQSPWADDSPAINLGADYRKDSLDYEPDALEQSGDIAGQDITLVPVHGSVDVKEVFGETRVPLIERHFIEGLVFEGGYRRSWYKNGQSSFSTDAYKLALDLTAVRGLRFRASQQRAVRAPNIQELFYPPNQDEFERDPCAGVLPVASEEQCARTGVSAVQYGHILAINSALFSYNAIDGGNPDLQPETATTRTLGVVLEPRFLHGFTATADWWDIELKGAISSVAAQTVVDTCIATGDPLFCNRIHRADNGSLWLDNGYVDERLANVGGFKLRGVDVEANYTRSIGRLGSLNADFRGTYVSKWIVDNGGLSTPFNCAGLYGAPCGQPQPRWRHTARLTWETRAGLSVSLNWYYIGAMKLAALNPAFNLVQYVSPAEVRLAPQSYFAVSTILRIKRRLSLRLGIYNVFDRQPPRILSSTPGGDGPLNGNTYPEWYMPIGRYLFAGFTANF